jgi:hypothetical protein
MIDSRLHDHAKDMLSNAPLTDDEKASAWDHFHDARDSTDLTGRLANVSMPEEIRASLIAAKQLSEPEPTPMDRVTAAINHLSKLDKNVLDIAENHPRVLQTLAAAMVKE